MTISHFTCLLVDSEGTYVHLGRSQTSCLCHSQRWWSTRAGYHYALQLCRKCRFDPQMWRGSGTWHHLHCHIGSSRLKQRQLYYIICPDEGLCLGRKMLPVFILFNYYELAFWIKDFYIRPSALNYILEYICYYILAYVLYYFIGFADEAAQSNSRVICFTTEQCNIFIINLFSLLQKIQLKTMRELLPGPAPRVQNSSSSKWASPCMPSPGG